MIIYIAVKLSPTFLTVLYESFAQLITAYEGTSVLIFIAFELLIYMWAIRESFADEYATFSFIAETKQGHESLFMYSKRLGWHIVTDIWWTQIWRMLLIPGSIVAGGLTATLNQHPGAANYIHLLSNNVTYLNIYAAFILSIWATRESLADRYRSFHFVSKSKNIYGDVEK